MLLGLGGLWFGTGTGKLQQPVQDRWIKHKRFQKEPVEILQLKSKSGLLNLRSVNRLDDDWLRGLIITVKNKSDKRSAFVNVELHFTRTKETDKAISVFPVSYGKTTITAPAPEMVISPGDKMDIHLSDEEYGKLTELLKATNYPASIKDVEVMLREVDFEDGTVWIAGDLYRRMKGQPQTLEKVREISISGRDYSVDNIKAAFVKRPVFQPTSFLGGSIDSSSFC